MNFIAPEFLYALGFLAIPILIHLFNFRRYKTVQFSQVRFLKSLKKQTQSTSKLKHFIVLACRCLALATLVFAFAQPYFSEKEIKSLGKKNGVIVYLDNSFSLQMSAEVGSLLDEAKNKAIAISDAYSAADKFQLHTNNFGGDEQRWLNKEGFISKLQSVDFSPKFRTLDAVCSRMKAVEKNEQLTLKHYIIGDLQKTSYEISSIYDSLKLNILPVKSQIQENVWIQNFVAFQPFHLPLMSEKFSLQVKQGKNEEPKKINGRLFLNGQLKNPFIIEMEQDSAQKEINFINPNDTFVMGKVSVKDYPVVFDDTFYFYYPTRRKIKVLHLFENIKNKSVNSLFEGDSVITYSSSTIKRINFSLLKTANLVVLENVKELSSGLISELTSFSKQGGSILFFPSNDMQTGSVNSLFNEFGISGYGKLIQDTLTVSDINTKSALFANVFEEAPRDINYPKTYKSWSIKTDQNDLSEQLFSYSNGTSFLKKYDTKAGSFYLFSSNLGSNNSNFGKHALLVPSLYNMALQAAKTTATSYLLDDNKITLTGIAPSESPLKLKKGNYEWIPKQNVRDNSVDIYLRNQITEPGFYSVMQNGIEIDKLAFNYNQNESNLAQFNSEEFKLKAEQKGLTIEVFESSNEILTNELSNSGKSQSFWKYCIILCLLFIGLEILFLRIL
jgi:hypothetical protein